jgi:hypothetical protein
LTLISAQAERKYCGNRYLTPFLERKSVAAELEMDALPLKELICKLVF